MNLKLLKFQEVVRMEKISEVDNNKIENTNIKCPQCGETFDFESLSKNDWSVESKYLLIRCPLCTKLFKILVNN